MISGTLALPFPCDTLNRPFATFARLLRRIAYYGQNEYKKQSEWEITTLKFNFYLFLFVLSLIQGGKKRYTRHLIIIGVGGGYVLLMGGVTDHH